METICPHCGQTFFVPPAMKGGIANCPACGRAVEVSGRSEGMYWALLALGDVAAVALVTTAFLAGGPAIGTAVLMLLMAGLWIAALLGQ